jgi:hypothetical protein
MMHAKGPQLADGYQWPYSAAAAVFDLGRSVVTACMSGATTSNQDPITRVDAEVVLANAGTVTIKETGGKSLTLRGDAFVVALNVPPPWALHHLADPKSEKNHFKVYCAMTGDTDCEWPLMRPKIPPFPGPCTDTSNLRPAGAPPPPDALPELTKAADLFCSTSSWP